GKRALTPHGGSGALRNRATFGTRRRTCPDGSTAVAAARPVRLRPQTATPEPIEKDDHNELHLLMPAPPCSGRASRLQFCPARPKANRTVYETLMVLTCRASRRRLTRKPQSASCSRPPTERGGRGSWPTHRMIRPP